MLWVPLGASVNELRLIQGTDLASSAHIGWSWSRILTAGLTITFGGVSN